MAHDKTHDHECIEVPELKRLNYFFGQMLGVDDFRDEQSYFREKMRLHNRCLHGYGTVCGLLVKPAPPQESCQSDLDAKRKRLIETIERLKKELEANPNWPPEQVDAQRRRIEQMSRELDSLPAYCADEPIHPRVLVECGMAIDCGGNEIIVRHTETLDLWHRLSREDRERLKKGPQDIYVSICFCEKPVSPVRPVQEHGCDPKSDCVFGKLQDSYRFQFSLEPPKDDERCDSCCDGCGECCLLLARIDRVVDERDLEASQVVNHVRRRMGLYDSTRISGINWTHGATYTEGESKALLRGLVFETSRPIRAATLKDGVVDVWVIRGGRGPNGDIYNLNTRLQPLNPDYKGYTRRFRVRYRDDENLDNGDRVLITVRGAFILDRCCRPLDGVHVGGFVPLLPDEEFKRFDKSDKEHVCDADPYGPPRSGIGVPGGSTFESWFYVTRRKEEHDDDHEKGHKGHGQHQHDDAQGD